MNRSCARLTPLLPLVFLLACSTAEGPPPPMPSTVILISIDTLRPDRLGAYGDASAISPVIDRLAADGVLFEEAIAHAPSTLASHASMLTSLLPQQHGASYATRRPLSEQVVTLAEVLQGEGISTAAFTGDGQMSSEFQLGQGFDVYRDRSGTLDKKVRQAMRWVDRLEGQPFFLFLHTYEAHHPYTLDPKSRELFEWQYEGPLEDEISVDLLRQINRGDVPLAEQDLAHIERAYAAGIRRVDNALRKLVRKLTQRGLYEDALIVLTSDHGEEFGEHGAVGWHSHTLFDELLRVPLIIKLPGRQHAGTSVGHQVRSIDIAPTIVALLGLEPVAHFLGTNLFAESPSSGSGTERGLPAVALLDTPARDTAAIRSRGWKWFAGRLFDLADDPAEANDLAGERGQLAERLRLLLEHESARSLARQAPSVTPAPSTAEALEKLGYL